MTEYRIRILRLIARLNIGGPAIQAITLSSELPRERYVTLLVFGNIFLGEGDMSDLVCRRSINSIYLARLGRSVSLVDDVMAFLRIWRIVKRFQPDIIHTHTAKAGTLGRLAAICCNFLRKRTDKIRLVHTYHGHVFHSYFSPLKTRLIIFIEKFLARLTDRIVVISDLQKYDICNHFRIARKEKVVMIPLGLDLEAIRPDTGRRKIFRKNYLQDEHTDRFLVGMIGRLSPIKNHHLLLTAVRHLKDFGMTDRFYFLIVGDGECRSELERKSIELEIEAHVRFTGWQKDLVPLYTALDIVVLTSRNEGTPVALIEAMAAEKPVIATAVGGVPDLVGKIRRSDSGGFQVAERGVLVPPGDHLSLSKALLFLYNHPVQAAAMASRAHEYAFSRYHKKRLLGDIQALYENLKAAGR